MAMTVKPILEYADFLVELQIGENHMSLESWHLPGKNGNKTMVRSTFILRNKKSPMKPKSSAKPD